jgi:hypothetical protein
MDRESTIADCAVTDSVSWFVQEQLPIGWVEGPIWTFTVQTASYPGSGTGNTGGAVPAPNIQKTVIACDNKIYYGRI